MVSAGGGGLRCAHSLLQRFVAGELDIIVPELFFYEIGSALSTAVNRNRITLATAAAALDQLERLSFAGVTLQGELAGALMYSRRFGISLYDASYLVAAESRRVPLVTCNERLLRALTNRLDWVLSVDQTTV